MADDLRAIKEQSGRRQKGASQQAANRGERDEHDRDPRGENAVGREDRLIGAERFARKGDEFDE